MKNPAFKGEDLFTVKEQKRICELLTWNYLAGTQLPVTQYTYQRIFRTLDEFRRLATIACDGSGSSLQAGSRRERALEELQELLELTR